MKIPESRAIRALRDQYSRGKLNRREFIDSLTRVMGSTAAAAAVLPLIGCGADGGDGRQHHADSSLAIDA